MTNFLKSLAIASVIAAQPYWVCAQEEGALRITIEEGIIEPMPIAVPTFVVGNGAGEYAQKVTDVIIQDLVGTGLFRAIPQDAHISTVTDFSAPVEYANWKAINADALVTGNATNADGKLTLQFRLHDVTGQRNIGEGMQFVAGSDSWRRMAHKVADVIYARLTGEEGYFDSRVVYIAEEGAKNDRKKRLAVMDYDGANIRYLTDSNSIVLAPRFSPNAREIVYTSYETGQPTVFTMNVDTLARRALDQTPGMTFAPRFSPDGTKVVMSLADRGNTDIYMMDIQSGQKTRLTDSAAIETAPSFSPDGSQLVFESDRGGGQQIYIMDVNGSGVRKVSNGNGRYGTPVWSPRGDMIAFTKMVNGRFHIGVMRTDGSNEKLLTASFLDEGPTWSPNGRVVMFFRETPGESGAPSLHSVDITGRNLKKIPTPTFGSDPAWSNLLN
ncbi:Tol-Pal system beta propeller repeat protein TolB [Amylibacter kogurei]|uniref:Tol-Pal system protein TolB n=1 Tax=Paramylibacter kogurei TaxID=1889778 RepID=A0A2G5K3D6_9RHOB|nr:Tol-Pal system beta propeller repeat protein TolB [Amylibacter kogurei]PIB24021.1 Tol-Pal system beta propeller repeat protein TolB [Amylibacter kogurei]